VDLGVCYDDAMLADWAGALGKTEDETMLRKRSETGATSSTAKLASFEDVMQMAHGSSHSTLQAGLLHYEGLRGNTRSSCPRTFPV